MPVYILAPDDHVFSLNRVAARMGFLTLGEDVRMFTEDTLDDLDLTKGDIVVGGVGFAQRGMRRQGLEPPVVEGVPDELTPFAGRKI